MQLKQFAQRSASDYEKRENSSHTEMNPPPKRGTRKGKM